jgi:uncharacterized membrane protein
MTKTKTITLTALMAALAIVMSTPPLTIPIPIGTFTTSIHFFQLPIYLCAILAGPIAGATCGAIGSLYMSATRIPFIIGGIAILGATTGLLAKKLRPAYAGTLAWLIQAPYVIITDYIWFTQFAGTPPTVAWGLITPIMINLTLEALICATLADIIIHYIKRAGITF